MDERDHKQEIFFPKEKNNSNNNIRYTPSKIKYQKRKRTGMRFQGLSLKKIIVYERKNNQPPPSVSSSIFSSKRSEIKMKTKRQERQRNRKEFHFLIPFLILENKNRCRKENGERIAAAQYFYSFSRLPSAKDKRRPAAAERRKLIYAAY